MITIFSHKCDAKCKQLLCDVTQSEVVWSGQRENDNDLSPSATNLSMLDVSWEEGHILSMNDA